MSEDRDRDAPSLEPPSLFGRKRRKAARRRRVRARRAQSSPPSRNRAVRADDRTEPRRRPPTPEPPTSRRPGLAADPAARPGRRRESPRPPREPWLTGRPAAILTGLLVGGLIVAATAGSLRICTEVKGTSSCGGQGFFLLVAILVVAVLVGTALLRLAQVPEPGSTSFLAVGLLSVATLLFLVGSIFQWWMVIVIPLVSVATFLLSHWVTSTYVDPANDGSDPSAEPEQHDVR